MSVAQVIVAVPPSATETITGGLTIPVKLEARCTTLSDGVLAVRAHPDVPKKGDTYSFLGESDTSLVCISVNIEPKSDDFGRETARVYSITATYSNSVDTASLGEDEDNPLDDPPAYEFSFNKYQVPAYRDIDDDVVRNGAGEPFDPPYMVEENRPVVTITRNEASFNAGVAVEYEDAVNSDSFAGVAAGIAKMSGISARSAVRGNVSYAVVTYEIEFRWKGWNPTKILALGRRYRKASDGPHEVYVDPATGLAPADPILLALDGTKLPDATPPVYHEFTFYREKAFGPLTLGL